MRKRTEETTQQVAPQAPLLDDEAIALIAHNMRGITDVRVRVIGDDPTAEAAISEALLAMNISVTSERLGLVTPPPRRRFSFQFSGHSATITVAPSSPLWW